MTVATILKRPFKVECKTDVERQAVVNGVRIFLKNLKAATGTATGLGDTVVAERWKEEAEHIEQGLLAKLNEQFEDGVGPLALASE